MVKNSYSMKYMPIHRDDWDDAVGIQRRDDFHSNIFYPTRHAEMMYGYPKDEHTIFFGNWTLIAPPGLPIVLLERFAPHTESVSCNGVKGHISLTFRSKNAFRRAWETWSFINHESAGHRLLVIANHAGCGPDDGRHPYMYECSHLLVNCSNSGHSINKIRGEPATLTMHLTSTLVGWNKVAHAYSFHWGEATLGKLSGPRKRSYEFPYPSSGIDWVPQSLQFWKNWGEIHRKSTNDGQPYKINVEKSKLKFVSTPRWILTQVASQNRNC